MDKLNLPSVPSQPARIGPMGGLIPVRDIVQFDDNIWRGKVIDNTTKSVTELNDIFFSRKYNKENPVDAYLCEYHIGKKDLLGFEFYLIPKEKCLFVYDPASIIIKPDPKQFAKRDRLIPRKQ